MSDKFHWYAHSIEYRMYSERFEFRVYPGNREGEWSATSWFRSDQMKIVELVERCETAEEARWLIVKQTLRLVDIWQDELRSILPSWGDIVNEDEEE